MRLKLKAFTKKAERPTSVTKIFVEYQSNYNGITMWVEVDGQIYSLTEAGDDDSCSDELCDIATPCSEAITEALYDDCDEDGEYQGEWSAVEEVVTREVKKAFGANVEVVVTEDGRST